MPLRGGRGGVGRLMANAILNFHFDYWHTSLIYSCLWSNQPCIVDFHWIFKHKNDDSTAYIYIYIYYYYDSRLIAIPEKEGIKSNVPPLKSCFDFVNTRCFYNSFMIRYWFRLLSTNNAL